MYYAITVEYTDTQQRADNTITLIEAAPTPAAARDIATSRVKQFHPGHILIHEARTCPLDTYLKSRRP